MIVRSGSPGGQRSKYDASSVSAARKAGPSARPLTSAPERTVAWRRNS